MTPPLHTLMLRRSSAAPLLGAVLSLALPVAAPVGAHTTTAAPGAAERRLEAFERATLGPRHAAEHAAERRLARQRSSRRLPVVARPAQSVDPAVGGRWDAPVPIPTLGVHAALLPTGKVLFFAYPRRPRAGVEAGNFTKAYVWDPVTRASRAVPPPKYRDPRTGRMRRANIFCAGQSLLADGQLLVTGGNLAYEDPPYYYKGLNKAYTFDPWRERWTEQPDMRHGRWYPSQVLMADGQTLVLAGYDEHRHRVNGSEGLNRDIELFTPPSTVGGRGRWTLLGHEGGAGEPFVDELYPHLFAMPSGRVLVAGPHRSADSWLLRAPGAFPTFEWDELDDPSQDRYYGNAVLLPGTPEDGSTRVLMIGGTDIDTFDRATASAETLDERDIHAGWKPAAGWTIPRSHANTVLLPDGSMVTVGGGEGTDAKLYDVDPRQHQVELYDPATGRWRLGATQAEGRAYHSTALLLPDGRVVSAGDDLNGGSDTDTAEIYSPPYLFRGPRPEIAGAPEAVEFGAPFTVAVAGAPATRAVLVAPGAVTHAVDMHQRVVPLAGTARPDGGLDLQAPASGELAPPGFYMLFVLTADGVPSVARWVKLGAAEHRPVARDRARGRSWMASASARGGRRRGHVGAAWATPGRDGARWTLDLGRAQPVQRLSLRWARGWPAKYVVSGSPDGRTFAPLAEAEPYKTSWDTTRFAPATVRYLRVTIARAGARRGVGLRDVRAFG